MATVHSTSETERLVAMKGNPPEVLAGCTWYMKDGKRLPLSDEVRDEIQTANEEMAGQGLRALGMAHAVSDSKLVLMENGDITVKDLTWLGITGMTDPVRHGVKDLIAGFHRAGIDTVMITGDQSATAYAVGKETRPRRRRRYPDPRFAPPRGDPAGGAERPCQGTPRIRAGQPGP